MLQMFLGVLSCAINNNIDGSYDIHEGFSSKVEPIIVDGRSGHMLDLRAPASMDPKCCLSVVLSFWNNGFQRTLEGVHMTIDSESENDQTDNPFNGTKDDLLSQDVLKSQDRNNAPLTIQDSDHSTFTPINQPIRRQSTGSSSSSSSSASSSFQPFTPQRSDSSVTSLSISASSSDKSVTSKKRRVEEILSSSDTESDSSSSDSSSSEEESDSTSSDSSESDSRRKKKNQKKKRSKKKAEKSSKKKKKDSKKKSDAQIKREKSKAQKRVKRSFDKLVTDQLSVHDAESVRNSGRWFIF